MANPDAFISFAAMFGGFFGFFVIMMACSMPETCSSLEPYPPLPFLPHSAPPGRIRRMGEQKRRMGERKNVFSYVFYRGS